MPYDNHAYDICVVCFSCSKVCVFVCVRIFYFVPWHHRFSDLPQIFVFSEVLAERKIICAFHSIHNGKVIFLIDMCMQYNMLQKYVTYCMLSRFFAEICVFSATELSQIFNLFSRTLKNVFHVFLCGLVLLTQVNCKLLEAFFFEYINPYFSSSKSPSY